MQHTGLCSKDEAKLVIIKMLKRQSRVVLKYTSWFSLWHMQTHGHIGLDEQLPLAS